MASQQDVLDSLAQVAKSLGNGYRLAIIERLAQTELSVDSLAKAFNLPIANVSQHLQILRRAGLVKASPSGKQRVYRLADERIVLVTNLLRQIAEDNVAEMEKLVQGLFTDEEADTHLDTVSQRELLEGLKNEQITLLDIRPRDEFKAGHLPTAISAPLDELEGLLKHLSKENDIVAYCRGPYCTLSHKAVALLTRHGFRIRRFQEGFPEWKASGLPIER